jgi:hypothetical protein
MLNILRVLHTIHDVADRVESGKPFELTQKFGGITVEISAVESDTQDASDIVIAHTDGNKLSRILVEDLIGVLAGEDINQDVVIVLPSDTTVDPPKPSYLVLNIKVGLYNHLP